MELLQETMWELVSSTKKFDTSDPMGRAMLNICIVFAQLERERIQKRVTDAYPGAWKAFHMSGQASIRPSALEPTVVEGIRIKKMVADSAAADHVRLMFEGCTPSRKPLSETLPATLRNRVSRFTKSQWFGVSFPSFTEPCLRTSRLGTVRVFQEPGRSDCQWRFRFCRNKRLLSLSGRDVKEDKDRCLKDQILVIAPPWSIDPSDTWLKCRKKAHGKYHLPARAETEKHLAGRKNQMRALWVCAESHPCTKQHRLFPLHQTDGKQRPSGMRENPQRRIWAIHFLGHAGEKFKDFRDTHGEESQLKLTAHQVESTGGGRNWKAAGYADRSQCDLKPSLIANKKNWRTGHPTPDHFKGNRQNWALKPYRPSR